MYSSCLPIKQVNRIWEVAVTAILRIEHENNDSYTPGDLRQQAAILFSQFQLGPYSQQHLVGKYLVLTGLPTKPFAFWSAGEQ